MKKDYWNIDDAQVVEKTGQTLEHWRKVLRQFGAETKRSNDSVDHLQSLGVPRYWARTLTTNYLKSLQADVG